MKHFIKRALKHNWEIIILVITAAYIRFFAYPDSYIFSPDATRDAIIGFEGAKELLIPLVGPFSSTGPFTFGPWYFFSLIFVSIIFHNPFSPWILMTVVSLVTIIAMYDMGRIIQSKKLGLLLALITVFTPSQIIVSGFLSNIAPVSFFSTLSLWASIYILNKKSSPNYMYILLGLFLGFGINAHYQMLGLLLLPLLVWYFSKQRTFYTAGLIFLGFVVTFVPILLFNLSHNWHTIRGILEMYQSRDRIYVPNSWSIYLFQFWPSLITFIFGTPKIISILLLLYSSASLFFLTIKKKISLSVIVLVSIFALNFIQLRFYWGERFFPYHYFLEPIIIFLTGYLIYRIGTYNRVGYIASAFMVTILFICMFYTEYERENMLKISPNIVNTSANIIQNNYPNRLVTIYRCNEDTTFRAEAISYILEFEKSLKNNTPVKLGIVGGINCKDPKGNSPETLKPIEGTAIIDFTHFTENELKLASWSAVSTQEVYKNSARWY